MLLKASMIRIAEPAESWEPAPAPPFEEFMDPEDFMDPFGPFAEEPEREATEPEEQAGEQEEALEAEEPADEPRAPAEYEQEFHPKFGVRGLRAIQGELHDLITQPISRKASDTNSLLSTANRWICIRDECHDLMVQPKGFVPPGVAPE